MVRAVFRGDVDLDGVDVVALRAAVLRDGAFEAPGVALFWNAAHAAFARDGAAVCVCTGRPRFTDADLATQASSDPAAAWLAAYAQHGPAAAEPLHSTPCSAIPMTTWSPTSPPSCSGSVCW